MSTSSPLTLNVVYHQCQCSLFKQFTTEDRHEDCRHGLFIINVNVPFLSNSQLHHLQEFHLLVVYHQCQCSLFKQFTTNLRLTQLHHQLFIINVNVPFLSNSQPIPHLLSFF